MCRRACLVVVVVHCYRHCPAGVVDDGVVAAVVPVGQTAATYLLSSVFVPQSTLFICVKVLHCRELRANDTSTAHSLSSAFASLGPVPSAARFAKYFQCMI